MLSFPTHTSRRPQLLDKSVYGQFKKVYFSAVENWITNTPGKTFTVYDIPGVVSSGLPNAVTPKNIMAVFQTIDIMPFNQKFFTDEVACHVV